MFLVFVGGPDWGGIEELFNLREGGGEDSGREREREKVGREGGRGREGEGDEEGVGREGGREGEGDEEGVGREGDEEGVGREGEGGEEEWDVMTYQIRTTY